MIRPTAILKTCPRSTRMLVRVHDHDVLKAALMPPPSLHARALPTLLEAPALWHQAPVRVVLCAAEAASWCRLGLLDEMHTEIDTVHYTSRCAATGAILRSALPDSVTSAICAGSPSAVCREEHARARGRDLRLHYAEHWPVGTIATQLAAHPDQVRRVLGLGDARATSPIRTRLIDPYHSRAMWGEYGDSALWCLVASKTTSGSCARTKDACEAIRTQMSAGAGSGDLGDCAATDAASCFNYDDILSGKRLVACAPSISDCETQLAWTSCTPRTTEDHRDPMQNLSRQGKHGRRGPRLNA